MAYVFVVAISLSGCFLVADKPISTPDTTVTHIVRYPGETLGVLSSWYTGTPRHWKDIQAANPTLDARRIRIGQIIQVPEHLVKNQFTITPKAIAAIEHSIAGAPRVDDAGWKEAEDTTYAYPVSTIAGCADLQNSLEGLHECANRIGQQVRVTNTALRANAKSNAIGLPKNRLLRRRF
jgi:hypothetical protein